MERMSPTRMDRRQFGRVIMAGATGFGATPAATQAQQHNLQDEARQQLRQNLDRIRAVPLGWEDQPAFIFKP